MIFHGKDPAPVGRTDRTRLCEQLLVKITTNRYIPDMTHALLSASMRAVCRTMRWGAQIYKQAWMGAVFGTLVFLILAIIVAALFPWARYWPAIGAGLGGVGGFLGYKIGFSIRVHRRQR